MSDWALQARMLCLCGGDTKVVNTRGRQKADVIWRQRQCLTCRQRFSTFETRTGLVAAEKVLGQTRRQMQAALKSIAKVVDDLDRAEGAAAHE